MDDGRWRMEEGRSRTASRLGNGSRGPVTTEEWITAALGRNPATQLALTRRAFDPFPPEPRILVGARHKPRSYGIGANVLALLKRVVVRAHDGVERFLFPHW